MAMAPLALRRISVDRVPESPMLNLMQRDGFAATVAVMSGWGASDADRDRIADRIERGRQRVAGLTTQDAKAADTLAHDVPISMAGGHAHLPGPSHTIRSRHPRCSR